MERPCAFLILVFIAFAAAFAKASPLLDLQVCPTCEINTLKQALEIARPGTTIYVEAGNYEENNLLINKPLRIVGMKNQMRPVIDAKERGNGFIIQADHVEISGLLIKNSGFSDTEEMAGIKVSKSTDCLIKNNLLENNTFGIYLAGSKSCSIIANQIHGTHRSESLSGNGIHIWNGENMTIEGNELTGNRDGIYFEFVKDSSIRKNKSFSNMRYGLHFMFSHNNEYRENLFQNNDCGVAVMYSRNVRMFRNRFENSHGPSSYGLLLKDISESLVAGNVFFDNTAGILLDGTTRTGFEGNLFKKNGWALRALGDTDSNKITRNDFIANTFDVTTNAGASQNEFIGNYWSRYRGLDLNHDGFGDEPFRPVQLSSMLMAHYEISAMLTHSIFFSVLDQIENALPTLTPETFKDMKPRMMRATDL